MKALGYWSLVGAGGPVIGLAIDTVMARINHRLLRWHRGLEHA